MKEKAGYIYILSNKTEIVFYIGVTSDLAGRIYQRKNQLVGGFTSRDNVDKLLYYEVFSDIRDAIAREKQLKGWTRAKKEALVNSVNPERKDLYDDII